MLRSPRSALFVYFVSPSVSPGGTSFDLRIQHPRFFACSGIVMLVFSEHLTTASWNRHANPQWHSMVEIIVRYCIGRWYTVHQATRYEWFTCLHVAFALALLASATTAKVSRRVAQIGATKGNSRSVTLAVGIVAGSVHEDSGVQLLLAGPGEHKGECEPAGGETADHGRRLVFSVVGTKLEVYVIHQPPQPQAYIHIYADEPITS